jgi:hypothetical protein
MIEPDTGAERVGEATMSTVPQLQRHLVHPRP